MELRVELSAADVLDGCRRRGLEDRELGELAGRPGSRHWHLRRPGRSGTLELTDWRGETLLKVAANRDGGWATELAASAGGARRS